MVEKNWCVRTSQILKGDDSSETFSLVERLPREDIVYLRFLKGIDIKEEEKFFTGGDGSVTNGLEELMG